MMKMKMNLISAGKSFLHFAQSLKNGLKPKSLKIKPIIIPSLMMGSYFFLYQKKLYSSKSVYSKEISRKFYIEGCETLQEGEMKEVKWGTKENQSILVLKYGGKLRAMSNYCPHFGAPLHTGILVDNVVKCPWHGASFDVTTGKTDISPSVDDLTTYEINEDGEGIFIHLPEDVKKSVTPRMCKRDPSDTRKYVIIGGGPAGLSAAETLRQNSYTGEIVILSKDQYVPYDRTMLTKWIPPTVNKIYIRSPEFLKEYDIDLVNGVSVNGVDNKNKVIKLSDGSDITYDKLLLATGGSPSVPRIPGTDRSHVYVLRTFDDLQKIDSACKTAKDIVIVGGSFLGMESASVLKKSFGKANVTVVDMYNTPFATTLGKEIGYALQKLHESKGVNFKLNNLVKEIKENSVVLQDGSEIPADFVLLGSGMTPNTDFISNTVFMDKSFVKTDKYLNTSDENIFAAGDIVSYPYFQTGEYVNFAHYVNAQQQGSIAAMNMLDKKCVYEYVPFFWTRQWDQGLQYTGYGNSWDEVFIDGNLNELKFVAYYIKDNKIVGFAAMNTPNAGNIMYEAFRNNKLPRATLIKNGGANLESIKKELSGVKVKCSRANCQCVRK